MRERNHHFPAHTPGIHSFTFIRCFTVTSVEFCCLCMCGEMTGSGQAVILVRVLGPRPQPQYEPQLCFTALSHLHLSSPIRYYSTQRHRTYSRSLFDLSFTNIYTRCRTVSKPPSLSFSCFCSAAAPVRQCTVLNPLMIGCKPRQAYQLEVRLDLNCASFFSAVWFRIQHLDFNPFIIQTHGY